MGGSFGRIRGRKTNSHPGYVSFHEEQSAIPSMMEIVQCNQPSTKWLADVPWKWWHTVDSVLVSDGSRLGTQ